MISILARKMRCGRAVAQLDYLSAGKVRCQRPPRPPGRAPSSVRRSSGGLVVTFRDGPDAGRLPQSANGPLRVKHTPQRAAWFGVVFRQRNEIGLIARHGVETPAPPFLFRLFDPLLA